MLRENLKQECLQEGKYRCASGGGTSPTTDEASVMEVEGRGSIIQVLENIEENCRKTGGTEMKKTRPFTIGKAQHGQPKETFTGWLKGVSKKSIQSMTGKMKAWAVMRVSGCQIEDIAKAINPVLKCWINYYGKFYSAELKKAL